MKYTLLGKLSFASNVSGSYSDNANRYSSNDEIRTYAKGYGGSGFKISPEVMEFKRTIVSEYEIED